MGNIEKLLEISIFLTNHGILTHHSPDVDPRSASNNGRTIYTSPGILIQRTVLSRAAVIIPSVLLGLNLLGLAYLTFALCRSPTWSNQLDSMALVRIGASLGKQGLLPPIGALNEEDTTNLESVEGLVEIVCDEITAARPVSHDPNTEDDAGEGFQLLNSVENTSKGIKMNRSNVLLEISVLGRITSENPPRPSVREWSKDISASIRRTSHGDSV